MLEEIIIHRKKVSTLWLRPGEAAVYCGISRSSFDNRAVGLPHEGHGRFRLYHVDVLDKWIAGQLDVSFESKKRSDDR